MMDFRREACQGLGAVSPSKVKWQLVLFTLSQRLDLLCWAAGPALIENLLQSPVVEALKGAGSLVVSKNIMVYFLCYVPFYAMCHRHMHRSSMDRSTG
jgi:hypothetical protein